ncbi:putative immunoglobulin-blocking virulence protein [Mesomycoplasma conjunctivae]|uniref:putative immunoglobulin-blocking virulence protein n=1 Tax=Mesomycoplasma conjunctivae TaxID=45361 RepID=UPI003DA25C25
MKVLKISKRKQIILGLSTIVVVVPVATSLGINNNFVSLGVNQIIYSTQAPSTIEKNAQDANDKSFVSPVANAKPQPKNEVLENTNKSDIIVDQPEEKPTPVAPVETPKSEQIASNPPTNSKAETTTKGDSLSQLISRALNNIQSAVNSEIKKTEERIAQLQSQVDEINRYYTDEHFNDPQYNPAKLSKIDWDNLKITLLRTKLCSNCGAEYDLEREKAQLNVLKQQQANPKTTLTAEELKSLRQGLLPSATNPYAWEYLDESKNPTINQLKRADNARVLNTSSYFARDSKSISTLQYNGWDRRDLSNQFSGTGVNGTSVKIYEYAPNKDNQDAANRRPFKVIVLDADDNNAFEDFQNILARAVKQDSKIEGVVIQNIGAKNSFQNVDKILQAIPSSIIKLTLFLDNYQATNYLRALENLKLRELELYTNSNVVSDNWAINPNALKNVDYISFDYQNNNDNVIRNAGEKLPGSIIFKILRWDKNDTIAQVNEGLNIVFDSKVNQRVFQGNSGGKGGYPINLDFSSTEHIKSFKGIDFDKLDKVFDEKIRNWPDDPFAAENYLGFKNIKFKNVTFQGSIVNGEKAFSAKLSDFDQGQLRQRLIFGEPSFPPGPNIYIQKDGQEYFGIPMYLSGDSLTGDAKEQIGAFIEAANRGGQQKITAIYVDNEQVKNQLGSFVGTAVVRVNNPNQSSSNSDSSNNLDLAT